MNHAWDISIREATEIQKTLRQAVVLTALTQVPRTIAGADVSFARFSDHFFAAVPVFRYPELDLIDVGYAELRVTFPYVPGYLSFREVPVIAQAYATLTEKPDVLLMDGHGIAHPRRVGVATHVGLELDIPTIGCAKTRLYGTGELPGIDAGSISELYDPVSEERVGAYVRTKSNVSPIIASPGHRISLDESISIALSCVRAHRIPEPTRIAHKLVNEFRKRQSAK